MCTLTHTTWVNIKEACIFGLTFLPLQVHEKIRADPSHTKKERTVPAEKKNWNQIKSTYAERKERLKAKLEALAEANEDEEEESDE